MHERPYIWAVLGPNFSQIGKKKLTWKIMKKFNASSHLYCPTSAVVGAPVTGPAGAPGPGAGFYPGAGARVGLGFKVLGPGWVRVAKFWSLGGSGFQSFATQQGPVHKEMAPCARAPLHAGAPLLMCKATVHARTHAATHAYMKTF